MSLIRAEEFRSLPPTPSSRAKVLPDVEEHAPAPPGCWDWAGVLLISLVLTPGV